MVDLFSVSLDLAAPRILRKLARKPLKLTEGNHFRFGGGVTIGNGNRIVVYATPRTVAETFRLSFAR